MKKPVYMDNHATPRVDSRVLDAMLPYFTEKFGNASSVNHSFGWEAADAVERSREEIARLLETDARNLALKGVIQAAPVKSHVITTAAEHRSVLDPLARPARLGTDVTVLKVDS